MSTKPKRPSDINQLAHLIGRMATGDAPKEDAPEPEPEHVKDPAAVALGRKGGKKGGAARAAKMTPEERAASAKKAAAARWGSQPRE